MEDIESAAFRGLHVDFEFIKSSCRHCDEGSISIRMSLVIMQIGGVVDAHRESLRLITPDREEIILISEWRNAFLGTIRRRYT